MLDWTDWAVFIAVSTGLGLLLMWVGQCIWRRFYSPPACWTVTVTDADGMLVTSAKASATGVAKLITDLKSGRFS